MQKVLFMPEDTEVEQGNRTNRTKIFSILGRLFRRFGVKQCTDLPQVETLPWSFVSDSLPLPSEVSACTA